MEPISRRIFTTRRIAEATTTMSIVHHFPLTAREMWLGTWRTGLANIPYRLRGDGHWPPTPTFRLGTPDNPYLPLLAASSTRSSESPPPHLHLWNIDDMTSIARLLAEALALYVAFDLDIRRFRRLESLLGFPVTPPRRRGLIALPAGEAGRIGLSVWEQGWPEVALISNPSPDFIARFGGDRPDDAVLYTAFLRREPTMSFADFRHLIEQCDWLLGCSSPHTGHLLCTNDLTPRFESGDITQVQEPPHPSDMRAPARAWLDAIPRDAEEIDWSGIMACDLRALLDYPNLRRLDVSRRWWLDTQTLSRLGQLTALNMRYCWVEDLLFLGPLGQLRQLSLNVEPLRGWQALTQLPDSLHHLDLERASIADLTQVSRLTSLQSINIAYTSVRDLSPLSSLKALTHLNIAGCPIDDYTAVNAMDGLQVLIAAEGQIPAEIKASLSLNITF